jgi:hypothetical protein
MAAARAGADDTRAVAVVVQLDLPYVSVTATQLAQMFLCVFKQVCQSRRRIMCLHTQVCHVLDILLLGFHLFVHADFFSEQAV